ncbi:hypothetical protein ACFL9U_05710 [Thermodesulfobacteriota bacterium]
MKSINQWMCLKCSGHHEIGIEDSDGRFSVLKPGMEVEARNGG